MSNASVDRGSRAGGSGSGNGTVRLDIQDNSGPARTGTATIAGKPVTVNQASGCTIISVAMADEVSGGRHRIGERHDRRQLSMDGCQRRHVDPPSRSAASDTGSGKVTYRVDTKPDRRIAANGTITIGGQMFTVNQRGG